eukprot:TRINITY_DN50889_c0_g1_i1.p1 TRINITY_DN50889_c0_g1~~TRINITY_DN50889_c0_g1_i1.p1  ORF type:complete len:169 (+),score=23.08 TRINITY_DN50889_c0_g1_i1:100-606(+)
MLVTRVLGIRAATWATPRVSSAASQLKVSVPRSTGTAASGTLWGFQAEAIRYFAGYRRVAGPIENRSNFSPYPMVPFGVKTSASYRQAKKAARKAAERARKAQEEKGMILDPKKQLRMELKRNSAIGWYRSMQIIKHLEMHERGKGPPLDHAMRERITQIARVVKMGR